MPPFAYVLQAEGNEVIAGTYEEIDHQYPKAEKHTFASEKDLAEAVQLFRENERIVTLVSDLPYIQQQEKDNY